MDINSPKRAHSLEGNLTNTTAPNTPMEDIIIADQILPIQQQQQQITTSDSPFRPLCSSNRSGQMNLSTQSLAALFPSSIGSREDYSKGGGIEGGIINNNNNENTTTPANTYYGGSSVSFFNSVVSSPLDRTFTGKGNVRDRVIEDWGRDTKSVGILGGSATLWQSLSGRDGKSE